LAETVWRVLEPVLNGKDGKDGKDGRLSS
jgi:hypothetical protein